MHLMPSAFDRLGPAKAGIIRWLAAACRRPGCDLSADDLIRLCLAGQAQLVLVMDGAAPVAAGVSQVRDHSDGRRSCWILAVGGAGARAFAGTLATLEAGAAAAGCTEIAFVGRRGWARLLPGYAAAPCEAGIHYSKRLAP